MKSCFDCHSICKAMCCKSIVFNGVPAPKANKQVTYTLPTMNADLKWYYELHGINVIGKKIKFIPTEFYHNGQGKLIVFKDCKYLTKDLKCKGHPTDKPLVCQDLDETTADQDINFITPGCKYEKELKLDE